MKSITRLLAALLFTFVAMSSLALATSNQGVLARWRHGAVVSDAAPVQFTDSLVLPPSPESVQILVPAGQITGREAKVSLNIGMPMGCYTARVEVDHQDKNRHLVRPILSPSGGTCAPQSSVLVQTVDLGYLRPGEHEIIVSNAMKQMEPVKFMVWDADALATF